MSPTIVDFKQCRFEIVLIKRLGIMKFLIILVLLAVLYNLFTGKPVKELFNSSVEDEKQIQDYEDASPSDYEELDK